MKILIIEERQGLLAEMLRYFKREGHVCEQAHTYQEGYKKLNNYEYDCVLVNLGLPGQDGLRLVRLMREEDARTGIILLSTGNRPEERIQGLEEGADDFLSIPFDMGELHARIKAVMRRKTGVYHKELAFGGLLLKLDERIVLADGAPVNLTKKEFEILVFLARNKNRVVTKESIAEHLWGDYMEDAISFDFIYAHVKNLRKKLAARGYSDYLKTVYGVGYKFEV
ncbi:MAG: response regulator transcription factor [Phaeodactylibacter sp.]|nr:response regulator transcription factor [Phaeodactylibacter sp.]MCB9286107.1 response regulator transcription factor [Lewinellaceae bacterium]